MIPRIEINIEEVDFQHLKMNVLSMSPTSENQEFINGFFYFTSDFFDNLELISFYLQIRPNIASIPLATFLEEPLININFKIKDLPLTERKNFLLGIECAIEHCSNMVMSASVNSQDKKVA